MALFSSGALLGQVTSAQGSDRDVLPITDPSYAGTIVERVEDSKEDFPSHVVAPTGAPIILLIMTDDVGFATSIAFGKVTLTFD